MLNLGPTVGAFFYEIGGFSLPFLICGSINTILAIFLVLTIPTRNAEISPELEKKEESNSKKNQESENAINENSSSSEEEISLLKESEAPNGTANTDDEALFKTALGYVKDYKVLDAAIVFKLIAIY